MASRIDFYKRAVYLTLRRINDNPDSVLHKVYRTTLLGSRRLVSLVARKPVAWVAQLQSARWLNDHQFEITGFAFERGIGFPDQPPVVRVWLAGPRRLRVPATGLRWQHCQRQTSPPQPQPRLQRPCLRDSL